MKFISKWFMVVQISLIGTMMPALANAHPTSTISTTALSPAPSVLDGTKVTITGKVVTEGQAASGAHGAVDADIPVDTGTIKIQQCISDSVGVPKTICDADSSKWTNCPTCTLSGTSTPAHTGTPDSNGEFKVDFDTAGLGGMTIGFRTHYTTPGGSHSFGTSHSEGVDLTVLLGGLEVAVDIKPMSCPNPINVNARGVLPVAILGTSSLDVNEIDVSSVRLEGVAPLRSSIEDVATPYEPFVGKADALDCTEAGSDGYPDLSLKFDLQSVVSGLPVNDGDVIVLYLTGKLNNGSDIYGEDVVQILKKK